MTQAHLLKLLMEAAEARLLTLADGKENALLNTVDTGCVQKVNCSR